MSERLRTIILTGAIVAIYALSLTLVGIVVYLDYTRPDRDKRPAPVLLISAITGFAVVAINQFFLMLKQTGDKKDADTRLDEMRRRLETLEQSRKEER